MHHMLVIQGWMMALFGKALKGLLCASLFIAAVPIASAENETLSADADILDAGDDPRINFNLGFAPQDGFISVEFQHGKHSVSLGAPMTAAYRYYTDPYRDTKYFGLFAGRFTANDANDTYNGVIYKDVAFSYAGVVGGYRWQWASGWNISLSLALEYVEFKYSNTFPPRTDTDSGVIPFPGLTIGYKF